MLYVFHGDDEFRAHEALRELRSQLDRDGNLAHNTVRIDEQDVRSLTPAALRAACHTASFFEETRLVIVEGLLKRLSGGGRRRGRRGRGAPEGGPISEADEFIDVLSTLPESTTVVLLDENATSMLEALPEGAAIRQFAKFRKADEVRPWAAQRAKTAGANFASGAFERLLTLVDAGHTGELASEIDKLATYAAEQPISIEDVDELVSSARNFMYWDLTDAVIDGRADRALGVLRRMDAKDQPAPYLSYMLVRQYRQILLAQSLLREGLSQQQIGAQMGLRDYPLRKAIEQASRYPADALEAAYRRLLENDVAVKTGVMEADAALEVLVVALAELARSPRRAVGRR